MFSFQETLRPGSLALIDMLKARGISVHLLSGDAANPVEKIAAQLGIWAYRAHCVPTDKTAYLEALAATGPQNAHDREMG